jgi:predicted RNase H-like HicB family nuclease
MSRMKFPYEIIVKWSKEHGAYVARIPELGIDLTAQASTPEEAVKRAVLAGTAILKSMASEKTSQ